ncbi:AMP-binding protein [Bacteroidales bacterium OttesenSCG-928-A17]|nr:AMP-binding protein [Bacteroidales bacterium OttesenSCG-928-A17]
MEKTTLIRIYEQALIKHFDRVALSDYGTDDYYTFGEIAQEIEKLHILFDELQIEKGEKIGLIGKNNARWCITYLATITYGAITVPILQDFTPDDVHHIVNHSESILLFSSDTIWETLDMDRMTNLRAVVSLSDFRLLKQKEGEKADEILPKITEKFTSNYPQGFKKEDIKYPDLSDDEVMVLNYTSGTVGFTKGVMITGANLNGNLVFAHETLPLYPEDRILSFLPLAHTYGCAFEFLFPFMEGIHVTLLNRVPSPNILIKAFQEVQPRLIISVPLILEKIYRNMIQPMISKKIIQVALRIPGVNSFIYKTINKKLTTAFGGKFSDVVIGGAPLNAEVEAFMVKIKFPVTVGYGMTECAPLVSFSPAKTYIPLSCGKALPSMQVRIDSVDPENEAGEIQVKGQNVMKGYYKNEEATEETFTEDGFLKTGDLGTMDKNRNIFIRGRSKSLILSANGQNIYPEEIEARLNNMPFVMESVVVSRDQKLIALVYPDLERLEAAGLSEKNLNKIMEDNKEQLNKTLANYERISEIQLQNQEFEKTPKKSIRRFLYS